MLLCIYLIPISSTALNSEGVLSSIFYILSEQSLFAVCLVISTSHLLYRALLEKCVHVHASYVHVRCRERFSGST